MSVHQPGQDSDQSQPAHSTADGADSEDAQTTARLSAIEARILGALMEKQMTTPDGYPLTVNSLLSACNQKSSRNPVSAYEQGEVVRTLRQLEEKRYVRYEMGARSERYDQRLSKELELSKKQQALLCVMILRGPQSISELQTRTQRLYEFTDRDDMQLSLDRMTQGNEPTITLIPRQAGQRDDRYGHLLCGPPEVTQITSVVRQAAFGSPAKDELKELKNEVAALRQQLKELYTLTGHSLPD